MHSFGKKPRTTPRAHPAETGTTEKRRRPFYAAAAGALALAGTAAGLWINALESPSPHGPKHWLMPEYAASELGRVAAGSRFIESIDNPSTYEILSAHTGPDVLPQATHVMVFDSFRAIRLAFSEHRIPGTVKGILYDNERWKGTPSVEQRQPFTYVRLAEQLVHAHGLLFMNAPAPDLNTTLEGNKQYDNYQGYLHLRLGALAKYADVFDIQAQRAGGVSAYSSFVRRAAMQAKGINHDATVLCGLTTAVSTSRDLTREVRATENTCDGYWLNVIGGESGVATALPMLENIYSIK